MTSKKVYLESTVKSQLFAMTTRYAINCTLSVMIQNIFLRLDKKIFQIVNVLFVFKIFKRNMRVTDIRNRIQLQWK